MHEATIELVGSRLQSSGLGRAVLLAGGLTPTPLTMAAQCSVLDLWLTPLDTVLDLWMRQIHAIGDVEVMVSCSPRVPPPVLPPTPGVEIVCDATEYRGPAGVVFDTCADMAAHETVLVGEAARFVDADLSGMLAAHARSAAAVTVACNADHTPAGVYLIERGTLDLVPALGFMDLKEQWLSRVVSSGRRTMVYKLDTGASHMLRSRDHFLAAARVAGLRGGNGTSAENDDPSRARSVVSRSASVHDSARVWGSVVMGGAVVEEGAVIARSLIAPGAHVVASSVIVDRVVPAGCHSN